MIELTIIACVVVIGLVTALILQTNAAAAERADARIVFEQERAEWHIERRFLMDRVIARHVGEIIPLDQLELKRQQAAQPEQERDVRPLIEGLS